MKFASEFILIYPLYTIMFGERGGLSAAQIGTVLAIGFVLSVLFEVPTGVVADKIPRKYVLSSAIVSKICALASWLAFPYFAGYLLGSGLFALGSALESGALQAYLYGTLGDESKKSFGRFWARVSAMVMFSYTVAYVLASIIGIDYPLLITLSIAACFVALLICATLPKDRLTSDSESVKPKIFASAVKHITSTPSLIRLLVGAIIIVAIAEVLIEYISLYYYQIGIETRYVPLMMALGNIIGAYLFWTLHAWENTLNRHKLAFIIIATALFVASFWGGVAIAAAGVLIYTRFVRVLQVQFESNMQHLTNEEARATITSIGAFSAKLVAAGIIALVGAFAVDDQILQPLRIALVGGAIIFILIQFLTSVVARRKAQVS